MTEEQEDLCRILKYVIWLGENGKINQQVAKDARRALEETRTRDGNFLQMCEEDILVLFNESGEALAIVVVPERALEKPNPFGAKYSRSF